MWEKTGRSGWVVMGVWRKSEYMVKVCGEKRGGGGVWGGHTQSRGYMHKYYSSVGRRWEEGEEERRKKERRNSNLTQKNKPKKDSQRGECMALVGWRFVEGGKRGEEERREKLLPPLGAKRRNQK